MRDGFQEIPAGTVYLGRRDERATQVVITVPPETQQGEIPKKSWRALGALAPGRVTRRDGQIVRSWCATVSPFPARQLPPIQRGSLIAIPTPLPIPPPVTAWTSRLSRRSSRWPAGPASPPGENGVLGVDLGSGGVDSYVVDFAHLRPSFCRGIGHIRISYVAHFLAEHDPVEPEAEK